MALFIILSSLEMQADYQENEAKKINNRQELNPQPMLFNMNQAEESLRKLKRNFIFSALRMPDKFMINPSKRAVLLSLLIILFVTSCKNPEELDDNLRITPLTGSVIMPLNIGNTWIYKVTEMDTVSGQTTNYFDTITITEVYTFSNEKWFGTNKNLLFANKPAGMMQREGKHFSYADSSFLYYKYPSKTGELYPLPSFIENGDSFAISREVSSNNEIINTPAGSYDCYKFTDNLLDTKNLFRYKPWRVLFLAPNIGLISTLNYKIGKFGLLEYYKKTELVSYRFN
ncbi:MAG: hypothetical protein HW421_3119 [Ignavibacteria bacterium]|nr:hypothetical protein [Ignavibacteria bacterium]